nr:PREDICTED: cyclic AMP-dependent transcription factor ATF-5-like [Linepithema humile]
MSSSWNLINEIEIFLADEPAPRPKPTPRPTPPTLMTPSPPVRTVPRVGTAIQCSDRQQQRKAAFLASPPPPPPLTKRRKRRVHHHAHGAPRKETDQARRRADHRTAGTSRYRQTAILGR